MSVFKIVRWDVIKQSMSSLFPAIYLERNEELVGKLNQDIPIQIQNTMSPYDGVTTMARCDTSCMVGGYRPNSNWIVLIPNIQWIGYPNELGNIVTI